MRDAAIGLEAVRVVDNVACGPSIGGLRIAPDVSTEECFRRARSMTHKNAAAGLRHGGGKSVLWGDPRMPPERKEQLVRAFAHALRHESDYVFGPDMGTDETCLAWIVDEIGRAAGLPEAIGGIPLDEIGATGRGLLHAAGVAARHVGMDLGTARVAIQGFGAVGRHAARLLAERGARIVAVSDSRSAIADAEGLDVAELSALKREGRAVGEAARGRRIDRDRLIGVDCDVLVSAARPDVLREDNAGEVRARLVLQGANIPFTTGAERMLHARGSSSCPTSSPMPGGVICAAMEYAGATQAAALATIAEKIAANTEAVLAAARRRGVPPREAAVEIATARERAAMATRRFRIK